MAGSIPLFQGIDIPTGLESYIKYLLIKQSDPQLVTRILTVVIDNTDNELLLQLLYILMNKYYNIVYATNTTISILTSVVNIPVVKPAIDQIEVITQTMEMTIILIDSEGVNVE